MSIAVVTTACLVQLTIHRFLVLQTTVCYFLADLIWVARVPICVKSPDVIIKVRALLLTLLAGLLVLLLPAAL